MMGTHRGRSLWILTVWWWLQSLSAAGRWSDLPSQWSTRPHSWESKPSGSTRLPLHGEQETGSQARLRQLTFSSRVFHLFLYLLRWKSSSSSSISFIHIRIVFWSECQVGSVCQSSQTTQSQANVAPLRQNRTVLQPQPPPPRTKHTGANPPNHIKRWLISMTTNYFHNQMIPCQRYLSSFSTHPFVRASKRSLQIVWSNFSTRLEESGPRHCLGTMERSWGICWSAVSLAKLISFSQRSWIHRHMNV